MWGAIIGFFQSLPKVMALLEGAIALFKRVAEYFQQKSDAKKVEEAEKIISRPIDPNLPKEEREKQSEKDFDDFFDKLRD